MFTFALFATAKNSSSMRARALVAALTTLRAGLTRGMSARGAAGGPNPVQKPDELVGVCTVASPVVVRAAPRQEVRAQNLPHRCSFCLIVDRAEERVLVQKRVAWKETYPSHFDPCPGGVMGPDEAFEENAARELAEEMGIVTGSALAPQPPEPLFDFWFEDATIRNWGRLFKVTFEGDLADLSLQDEEVESVSWMGRAELARLLDTGPVCPDAALACRRWLASSETGPP